MDIHTYTLEVTRIGYLCCQYSDKPLPSTMDEIYVMMADIGLDIKKGDSEAVMRTKVADFLNRKNFDRAMKVL